MKVCYNKSFTIPKQSQDLDPPYKMALDFRIFWNKIKLCLIFKKIRYVESNSSMTSNGNILNFKQNCINAPIKFVRNQLSHNHD